MRKTLLACCTVVALAGFMTAPGVYADPPPGKGKPADKSQQSGSDAQYAYPEDTGKGKGDKNGKGNHDEPGYGNDQHGKGGDADNHGQRVSECNHRANDRKLQGRDRKEFVDWCVDRGERYGYDDRRWSQDRGCYREADDRKLDGDGRRRYVDDCIGRVEREKQGKSKH